MYDRNSNGTAQDEQYDIDDIAIDDYELRDERCEPLGHCDFEQDTCAWHNADDDWAQSVLYSHWIRHRGPISSEYASQTTGPRVDHTLGTEYGTYMFLSSKYINQGVGTAHLVSPVFGGGPLSTVMCFEFFYFLNGKGTTRLDVLKRTFEFGHHDVGAERVVWSAPREQEDAWKLASVTIVGGSSAMARFVLILKAESVFYAADDLAIDDLTVTLGHVCPEHAPLSHVFTCSANDAAIAEKQMCNFVADCPGAEEELECGYDNVTFEDHGHKWEASREGLFVWTVESPLSMANRSVRAPATGSYTETKKFLIEKIN